MFKIEKHLFVILFYVLNCFNFSARSQTDIKKTPLNIGEKIELKSAILNEIRILNIYLPQGYSTTSEKKYPVIYLLDGSMDEDFIHISGLVQFSSFSWINILPESIVVGISNVDRKRDFTFPTTNEKDKIDFPTTGKSEQFIQFIEKELQPFIEKSYKTNNLKTIIGQSLGGLLATEILFKKPELFTNYIIVSPSLWWDNESLLKKEPAHFKNIHSIYISVGKEGETMERTTKELHQKLQLLKREKLNLYFDFFEDKNHGDALHLSVYKAFECIFKNKK
ncbi:MAG: alpha/beta hydrolase [Bacteroidia bacterium]|nr:alpha/beta hydrolase [Bacteroidia bacterium]